MPLWLSYLKMKIQSFFILIEFLRNCSHVVHVKWVYISNILHQLFFFQNWNTNKTLNTIPRLDMFMTNRVQKKPLWQYIMKIRTIFSIITFRLHSVKTYHWKEEKPSALHFLPQLPIQDYVKQIKVSALMML